MNSMKILPGLGLGLLLLAFPAAAKDVLQGRHITVSGAVLTSDFAIHRERGSQSQRGVDRPGERFVVRNLLQVTIRDIERAGVLLDRLVEAGANEVRGIRFTLQDDTQMALQARALAAADARQKAQHLAELHDTRLGKVLRISKSSVRGGRP